jgi:hypothetical protein
MENFYVVWLHDIATERMALRILTRLSQVGDIEQIHLGFPEDGGFVVHATTSSFASIRFRVMLAEMGLACASPTRQVHPKVAQMPQGALPLGNRRAR